MWSIAGLRPVMLHVMASPAFGRRRFHTNTDFHVFALVCCCSLIKIVFGMKLVLDEIVLDEIVLG